MALKTATYKCPACREKYQRLHFYARHPEEKTIVCFACAKKRSDASKARHLEKKP